MRKPLARDVLAGIRKEKRQTVDDRLTIQRAYQYAYRTLQTAQIENAAQMAHFLIRGLLNLEGSAFARLYTEDVPLLPRWSLTYALKQLQQGMPFHYVLGESDFMGLRLKVGPGVLIPRIETEGLVEGILKRTGELTHRVLDIGTGSGAIALALAVKRPLWRVVAIEKSPVAALYAKTNMRMHGVTRRVHLIVGDALTVLADRLQGAADRAVRAPEKMFHVIVSNPPYIARDALAFLPPSVQKEPRLALDGGKDGLFLYQNLVPLFRQWLMPGGLVALEIGYDQGETVPQILRTYGFQDVMLVRDVFGQPRYVYASLTSS